MTRLRLTRRFETTRSALQLLEKKYNQLTTPQLKFRNLLRRLQLINMLNDTADRLEFLDLRQIFSVERSIQQKFNKIIESLGIVTVLKKLKAIKKQLLHIKTDINTQVKILKQMKHRKHLSLSQKLTVLMHGRAETDIGRVSNKRALRITSYKKGLEGDMDEVITFIGKTEEDFTALKDLRVDIKRKIEEIYRQINTIFDQADGLQNELSRIARNRLEAYVVKLSIIRINYQMRLFHNINHSLHVVDELIKKAERLKGRIKQEEKKNKKTEEKKDNAKDKAEEKKDKSKKSAEETRKDEHRGNHNESKVVGNVITLDDFRKKNRSKINGNNKRYVNHKRSVPHAA
jgi:hypothetical protein